LRQAYDYWQDQPDSFRCVSTSFVSTLGSREEQRPCTGRIPRPSRFNLSLSIDVVGYPTTRQGIRQLHLRNSFLMQVHGSATDERDCYETNDRATVQRWLLKRTASLNSATSYATTKVDPMGASARDGTSVSPFAKETTATQDHTGLGDTVFAFRNQERIWNQPLL